MEIIANRTRHPMQRMLVIALMTIVIAVAMCSCAVTAKAPAVRVETPVQPVVPRDNGAPKAGDVVVLVSDDSPAYTGVASVLAAQIGPAVTVRNLRGEQANVLATRQRVQAMPQRIVIAVGMLAAETARDLNGKSVVFCQVFNYAEHDLIRPWMKGVSAVPPVADQFRAWRKLDPRLKRIGLIVGPGLGALEIEARAAARAIGAELIIRESRSDKETRLQFGKLVPKVDGFWLLPDNRILSSEVLRDMLATAVKRGKRMAVFNQDILRLGGVLSAEADPRDVADQVVARVLQIRTGRDVPGPDIKTLTRTRITVNDVLARELGLVVPRTEERRRAG